VDRTAATAGDPSGAAVDEAIDARLLIATGLLVFAGSCFMNLYLDQNYAAPQLFWPDVIRGLGQAIV
jgi:DHA2 family multidrug resistance protein